jgi:hypothetical protein
MTLMSFRVDKFVKMGFVFVKKIKGRVVTFYSKRKGRKKKRRDEATVGYNFFKFIDGNSQQNIFKTSNKP